MEEHALSFDVCIVCALPEEARAFLEIVRRQCEEAIEERSSPRYHYSYRFATLRNNKNESLNLHISWLPRYGPQEMALHLSHVLEEYQPRIAIMTGICAGDRQRVQLGDLVVAERTFSYDNGKFTLDEHGRSIHEPDTITYQLDANILQFLGLFDDWKPLVARLKHPQFVSRQDKRRKIACHIKAMASGSAVRADNPFVDVRAPVRGTVAIDMEGAAFGLTMSRHPLIPWLIVKGVCDHADQDKNDAYHDYAARASAIYALSFIRAFVTNELLPRPNGSSSSSQTVPSGVWNVPHSRNAHFTGRDELLDQLHQRLMPAGQTDTNKIGRVALTQPQAIKGLGGIGKTQIAVEYAYRARERDYYTHTFWVNGASEETIITSFVTISELLPSFAAKDETDQGRLVEAVKRWLEQCEQRWLLIFDNADDISIVWKYLPQRGNGSILLTTRADAVGSLATSIKVETMGFIEGTHLLLRRAQRFEQASDEEINEAGNIVVALDHFPLALDQAGAYIEETGCSFVDYLQIYQAHRQELLARRGLQFTNYPEAVATTWFLSFQKVEQANPAAAELLRLCAFLAPDKIPEELIISGATYWSSQLQSAVADLFAFNQMIEELLKFSLVQRLVETHTLSIHRLVQAVQMDSMEPQIQRQWAERVVRAVNDIFPNSDDLILWSQHLRYLSQAQVCYHLINQHTLMLMEAIDLLNKTGSYLIDHALHTIAKPLIQRALEMSQQLSGSEHPDTVQSLSNLAHLYYEQGAFELAVPLYQYALDICERTLENESIKITYPLQGLANLYNVQGKYELAETFYLRVLSIRERVLGSKHPQVATTLTALGIIYYKQGRYELAEPVYQRALHLWEQTLGAEHPRLAYALSNLATLYKDQGKYELAEPLYQRALYIREQQLGFEHPQVAIILDKLAALYHQQKKDELAESLYHRALALYKQVLGPEHPHVAVALNNLAVLYKSQGKYTQAEDLYQRALAMWEQRMGSEHPSVAAYLNNLASLYQGQGKYEQAELLYQRAISIREQQLGSTHPQTKSLHKNYALLLRKMGREAEAIYQETLNQEILPPS